MLTEAKLAEIVDRLANGKFVNSEAFSSTEVTQILHIWRQHPNHPNNSKDDSQ